MSSSSELNVWTVLWQSPDGKPFLYRTSPQGHPREVKPRKFEVSEVQKYRRMVHKRLPGATFRCLSNVDVPGVECVPLLYPVELFGWFAKYEMWRPGLPEGRNVYFDLDTLLLRGIQEIAEFPAPFAIAPGMSGMERPGPAWQDQEGKWRYPRYQGSCIVWDADQAKPVWDRFQAIKDYALSHYASEQDFLGSEFPDLPTMPRNWFTKLRNVHGAPRDDCKVVLTMMAHNDGAAQQYRWVRQFWPSP